MTARFWSRVSWSLALLCLASFVTWAVLLGWNPPLERMIEHGPFGFLIPAFGLLTWLAGDRWAAAIRRREGSAYTLDRHPAWSPVPPGHCPVCKAPPDHPCDAGLHS